MWSLQLNLNLPLPLEPVFTKCLLSWNVLIKYDGWSNSLYVYFPYKSYKHRANDIKDYIIIKLRYWELWKTGCVGWILKVKKFISHKIFYNMEPKQSECNTVKFLVGRGTITKLVKVTVSEDLASHGWKEITKGKKKNTEKLGTAWKIQGCTARDGLWKSRV